MLLHGTAAHMLCCCFVACRNDWPCSTALRFVCGPASIASDCARYPCASNASSEAQQQCTPSCACAPGLEYIDDILGCVEPIFSQVLSIGDGVDYRLVTSPLLDWEQAEHFCKCVLCASQQYSPC